MPVVMEYLRSPHAPGSEISGELTLQYSTKSTVYFKISIRSGGCGNFRSFLEKTRPLLVADMTEGEVCANVIELKNLLQLFRAVASLLYRN
jgi:hypothetical protein